MADGVNVDFSLLKQPDYLGAYQNAFEVGRRLAGQRVQDNALTAYGQNPTAPLDPRLMAVNPALATQIQGRQTDATNQGLTVQQAQAEAGGDNQAAMGFAAQRGATGDVMDLKKAIDDAPEAQRQAAIAKAQQTNEALAHVLMGLSTAPPEQRLAMAQHIAQQTGLIDPAQIGPDDVTDAGLKAHLDSAMTVDQFLRQQQEAEAARHNQVDEGLKGQEVGIARGHLGVAQAQLGLERHKFAATQPVAPAAAPAGGAPAGPAGSVPLSSIPGADQAIVQAYIEGRMPIPTGAALRNPAVMHYLQEASQVDPTFDAANYQTRVRTRTDMTSGKSAQNITSLNTAVGHLQDLSSAATGLHNGPIPAFNAVGNTFDQAVGHPAVNTYNSAKAAVASEVAKVFQGGAPHEAEIKGYLAQLDGNQSPAQIHATVGQIASLLNSRLQALRDQYKQGMGPSNAPLEVVHPHAAEALQRLRALGAAGGGAPAHGPAPIAHGSSQILNVEP